jgi:hypothetical protein
VHAPGELRSPWARTNSAAAQLSPLATGVVLLVRAAEAIAEMLLKS